MYLFANLLVNKLDKLWYYKIMELYSLKIKSSKNTNIFVVQSSVGEYEIHSDVIVKFGIAVEQFDEQKFWQALEESNQIIAFNLVAKYLSSSMKTEKQIKDYLYKKEFKTKTINVVVEKLKEYHLVDDHNFAANYIKSNPNFSANKLKQKLFGFGVDKQIVAECLDDFDDFDGCQKSAQKFLKNKPLNQKTKEKVMHHLLSKGYNWNTIGKVLNDYHFEFESFDD